MLNLKQPNLNSLGKKDLLDFNNSITRLCGTIDLTISIREGMHRRKMTLTFLIIHYKSAFKCILGRSFLTKLDAFSSDVHLKIVYLDEEWAPLTVGPDLWEARRIKRIIREKVLVSDSRSVDGFDLDSRKDVVKPILDGEFESVQLGENSAKSIKIGYELSPKVRYVLIECFRENADLFAMSLHKILDIVPHLACHQLNLEVGSRYVS